MSPARAAIVSCILSLGCLASAEPTRLAIAPDKPVVIPFAAASARFVRVVLEGSSSGNEPCLDELEVRGPGSEDNLAAASRGAKATASSCLAGYAQHTVGGLNDGAYGNARSWIPASAWEEWAAIELPESAEVCAVVLSRDREGDFSDRVPIRFRVELSDDGVSWRTVASVEATARRAQSAEDLGGPSLPVPSPPGAASAEGPLGRSDVRRSDALGFANLALEPGARASASSVLGGGAWPIHQIAHLNDGIGGNEHSWISDGEPSWAEIDFGEVRWVYRVGLANDREGRFSDRGALPIRVLVTEGSDDAAEWREVAKLEAAPLQGLRDLCFEPTRARRVRIALDAAGASARLDEIEVYGSREPIAAETVRAALDAPPPSSALEGRELLEYAFLGEEHAWLKTWGRADLDPNLVPYNGRVREYPRHRPCDVLPLPSLGTREALGPWREWSSRGVARVAFPYQWDAGPLVTQWAECALAPEGLLLAVGGDRLLSSHLAVLSGDDWSALHVLAVIDGQLALRALGADGQLGEPLPLEGTLELTDGFLASCLIPTEALPAVAQSGLRIGLGMGGRHTASVGRPVRFRPGGFGLREEGDCRAGSFMLTASVPPGGTACGLSGCPEGATEIAAGERRVWAVPAEAGAIGPERRVTLADAEGAEWSLELFRYDPTGHTLDLADALAERLADRGVDVSEAEAALRRARGAHADVLARAVDRGAEREEFYAARSLKRELMLRDPDLEAARSLLYVERHAFQPSHIYTDYTDAPFRPGGAVCRLDIPWRDDRLEAEGGRAARLFESAGGIARDPVIDWAGERVLFGYRPTAEGFYHMMSVPLAGGAPTQITDGPYHDFYPLPLPDGDIAFITTRCASRVFCFRWTSSVLFRMHPDGTGIRPLSHSSLSEWAPALMHDGRILWTRWEYVDKGADFSQTLWSIRPDGTEPELVFGNDILQPNGYASARELPTGSEIVCTLVSHFGDINGPIALVDPAHGRSNPEAIRSLTPEVPWPGMWPATECFRDPLPLSNDLFVVSHAPRDQFGIWLLDRHGNREVLRQDATIGYMAPTLFRKPVRPPAAIPEFIRADSDRDGQFVLLDVSRGLTGVEPGRAKWLRVVEEVRHNLNAGPNVDHADFMKWYASPVDIVYGPYGWPAYTAKASLGLVPIAEDGSARFSAPSGRQLYFEVLDEDFNELQRMRSAVHLQPGESRSCVGCHEGRGTAPPSRAMSLATPEGAREPERAEWEGQPFSYERVVQPVLDRNCVSCHGAEHKLGIDLRGERDADNVPTSYRTLVTRGLVNYVDCGWNSGGCEKREPMTFGSVRSRLWEVLGADGSAHGVPLTRDEILRVKTWIDLNCPLWPDYRERRTRGE